MTYWPFMTVEEYVAAYGVNSFVIIYLVSAAMLSYIAYWLEQEGYI